MADGLQIQNLTVRYAANRDSPPVLRQLSLTIEPGGSVGIFGDSGSGKSTLARAIPRLLPSSASASGSISFDGADLLRYSDEQMRAVRGCRISYIPQEPSIALNPVVPAGAQVADVLRAHGRPDVTARREAMSVLRRLFNQPERVARSYPHQLSGGERQRVVICQAIAAGPSLLIADEPTSALDSIAQREFLDLLKQLRRQAALSLVLFSHQLRALRYTTERVLRLQDGRLHE